MAPAAEMRAAEMPTAIVAAMKMSAPMTTAVMTPAVSTAMATAMATTVTAATFRSGISCGRQRGRHHSDGDTDVGLNMAPSSAGASPTHGAFKERWLDNVVPLRHLECRLLEGTVRGSGAF
jgi:hypothetical protein